MAGLPKSGIRDFFDIVAKMKDAISLGVGEPEITHFKGLGEISPKEFAQFIGKVLAHGHQSNTPRAPSRDRSLIATRAKAESNAAQRPLF